MRPELELDIEKERTRRSLNGKVSLCQVAGRTDFIGM